nr:MAG TPA: venom polypeptide-like protein [Caudoviricetes sp.]
MARPRAAECCTGFCHRYACRGRAAAGTSVWAVHCRRLG